MVRKTLALATLAAGLAAFAFAHDSHRATAANAAYRIQLRGHTAVLSRDQPVRRGSVVLFHRYPDGRLTSVPVEEVAVVATDAKTIVRTRTVAAGRVSSTAVASEVVPLEPGEAILLGPTGDGSPAEASQATAADAAAGAPPAAGTGAMVNGVPLYGGNGYNATGLSPTGLNPTGLNPTMAGSILNPTLQRPAVSPIAVSPTATSPTTPIAPNGYPATSAAPAIGPNGYPATSAAPAIGPNGYPSAAPPATASPRGK